MDVVIIRYILHIDRYPLLFIRHVFKILEELISAMALCYLYDVALLILINIIASSCYGMIECIVAS